MSRYGDGYSLSELILTVRVSATTSSSFVESTVEGWTAVDVSRRCRASRQVSAVMHDDRIVNGTRAAIHCRRVRFIR